MEKKVKGLQERLENLETFFTEIFNCSYKDIEKVINLYKMANNLNVEINWENFKDIFSQVDLENFINQLIYFIMYEIISDLAKDLPNNLSEKLLENFNPFINYFDSWFNIECLDNYNNEDRKTIIKKLTEEIKKW